MILAHELAHIRRNDFFVNLMQAVVETLLFYHPAVWWISNRIRVEREHCCDDVAVSVSGKPLVYARALTRLEELRVEDAHAFVAANGGSLIGRIRRLAGARAESPNAPSRFVAGAALLTVLLALIVAPSLPLRGQQPKADTPTPKPQAAQTTVEVKADDAADEDQSDDAEAPDAEDQDNEAKLAVARSIPDGITANAPMVAPMAIAPVRPVTALAPRVTPPVRPVTARVAPRVAMRALANLNLDDLQVPDPPDPPDAPTPRPDRHRRRHIGEGGKLTVDDLIELRAAGVTPAYIDAMRSVGLGELSLDEITEMRAVGVTPEYIKSLRDAGIKFDNAHNVTELRAIGVTGEYLAQMRAAGYGNLTTKQLTEMRAMGVTPSYIKQMSDAGYRNLTPHELVELKAQGVRPDFIKSLNDAGYTNLSVKDLVRMAAMGVNAEFIRDLAKYKVK
jgi:hypothetical protein